MSPDVPRGRFVWYDLMTTDPAGAQAQELGATVYVPRTDIPEVGRFAVLADPQGAVFAIYTPGQALPDEAPAAVG